MKFHMKPGDLCMYMSRLVLVVERQTDDINDWCLCQELGANGFRKIREDVLVMVQSA
jgi:hypothetical protein